MQLTRKKKSTGATVGLAIEAGRISAAEVRMNGSAQLTGSGFGALEQGTFHEGEVLDRERLAATLKNMFAERRLPKQVRLGIGNQRVVVRTLRMPRIEDPKEMDAAVRFQAQEEIPMPLEQAVLEYQVVGGQPSAEADASNQVDVVVAAARRDMIDSFLGPLRDAGLEPVGIDLSAFAMIRALAVEPGLDPEGQAPPVQPAVLYCHLGDVTNLAVARGRACLFTRVSPVGIEATTSGLATACGLTHEHAEQWLLHVGLEQPLEQLEGAPEILAEARRSLEAGATALVDELRLSLDYYGAQDGTPAVERIVLAGPGSAIPGLAQRLEEGLGTELAATRPAPLANLDPGVAALLTLPFGLALAG